MLLGPQLREFWELRMARFRRSMRAFAQEQLQLTRRSTALWEELHTVASGRCV